MADTSPCVVWEWEPAEKAILTEIEPQKGWFWDFTDDKLLWRAIRNGNLESRLRAEFTFTNPVWYGLWMDSPLNAAQCSVLYDLFSLFIIRYIELKYRIDAFLKVLQKVSSGQGRLKVWLGSPGHTDFGIHTTFAHCPRCKCIAPVPRWDASEYHDEISCPICDTRYIPAEIYSKEEMAEPDDNEGTQDNSSETKKANLKEPWFTFVLVWDLLKDISSMARASYISKIRVRRRPRPVEKFVSGSRS